MPSELALMLDHHFGLGFQHMRSNTTPHAAAREASGDLDAPAARAGGRER